MKNLRSLLAWTISGLALTAIQSRAQSTYEPYTFTTLAGNVGYGSADGTGSAARFDSPNGVAVDSAGNVYVADEFNHTIRKVTPARVVTTLAGLAGSAGSTEGTGSAARFSQPYGVAVDSAGNVYVADTVNSTIRKVTPAGVVTTLAGLAENPGSADGTEREARFNYPRGVAVDSTGNVYVADTENQTIRKVTPAGVVTTLAGRAGSSGSADGTGSAARFSVPYSVTVDSAGNVYVADGSNSTIRRVTPAGVVMTLAGRAGSSGGADGTGSVARFSVPQSVAVDSVGNVYVADTYSHTIRKVTPAGVVTTLAGLAGQYGNVDGTGSVARFNYPRGVAVDSTGNVYVADTVNNTIRKVTPTAVVTTLAGLTSPGSDDGPGGVARFWSPSGVAVDSAGNVYVADTDNSTIRKVTPAGVVATLAGRAGSFGSANGTGSAARFSYPSGVAVDSAGNVYVADSGDDTIRKVTPAGVVTTLAGRADSFGNVDGTGSAARFNGARGVAVDSAGNVYVSDRNNSTIRKVTPSGAVTTMAGLAGSFGRADGTGSEARFYNPLGVAVDSADNVYVADTGNHTIRKVTPAGVVTTLAGLAGSSGSADGTGCAAQFNQPSGLAVDNAGNIYVADGNGIRKVTPAGVVTTLAGLGGSAVAVDNAGNVYVADAGNNTIRKGYPASRIPYEPYTFTTLAGNTGYGSADGTGSDARFWNPSGVAVDSAGSVYVADSKNHTIRKVTAAGVVTTLAGRAGVPGCADGTGNAAQFNLPEGVAVDTAGTVYVGDTGNNTIRKVTQTGVVTTVAGRAGFPGSVDGTGNAAQFNLPGGVAVDSTGNVYVADSFYDTIRKVTRAGVVTTLAGLAGNPGSTDGTGSDARFARPSGVAADNAGNVYVADDNGIRKVTPAGVVTTLAGLGGSAVAVDTAGNLYLAAGDSIQKATLVDTNWLVTTLASLAGSPTGVAVDGAGNVYVADSGNNIIRKVPPVGLATTVAGLAVVSSGSADGTGSAAQFSRPSGVAVDSVGNVYVTDGNGIRIVTPAGVVTTLARLAQFAFVAVDSAGNVYATEGNEIRTVTPAGVVTTLPGLEGRAVAVDTAGTMYLASGNSIEKATLVGTNWVVTTLAGLAGSFGSADGTGIDARFNGPAGAALDSAGNVYVADRGSHTIRRITPAGVVTTLAGLAGDYGNVDGTGSAARFNSPYGVAVDRAGNIYVADEFNFAIRKVTPAGVVTTLAGLAGSPGSADGTGSDARFGKGSFFVPFVGNFPFGPAGVAVDSAGNVYVADTGNNTIRKGCPALMILNSEPGFGFTGGQFGFNLTGPAGRLVVVEASNDLVSWLPLWTNTFTGALNFSDPQSGVHSNRFYRARLP